MGQSYLVKNPFKCALTNKNQEEENKYWEMLIDRIKDKRFNKRFIYQTGWMEECLIIDLFLPVIAEEKYEQLLNQCSFFL